MKDLIMLREDLQEAVKRLIRKAASHDEQHNDGEVQLYAVLGEAQNGNVIEFVYHEIIGQGNYLEGPDLVYLGRDRFFDPLHDENLADWWKQEGRTGSWQKFREHNLGEWFDLYSDWQQLQIDDNIRDWTSNKLNLIIDELEREGFALQLID